MSTITYQDKSERKEVIPKLDEFDDIDKELAALGLNFPDQPPTPDAEGVKSSINAAPPAVVASKNTASTKDGIKESSQFGIAYCTDPQQLLASSPPPEMLKRLANGMKELVNTADQEQVQAVQACDSYLSIRTESVRPPPPVVSVSPVH